MVFPIRLVSRVIHEIMSHEQEYEEEIVRFMHELRHIIIENFDEKLAIIEKKVNDHITMRNMKGIFKIVQFHQFPKDQMVEYLRNSVRKVITDAQNGGCNQIDLIDIELIQDELNRGKFIVRYNFPTDHYQKRERGFIDDPERIPAKEYELWNFGPYRYK